MTRPVATAGPARRGRGALAAVLGGLVVALVVLSPPVERWTATSLTAHMGQHVLLIGLAAPLLALGAPARRAARLAALLVAAVVVHTVVVLGWHAPALFDAAERAAPLHAAEHLSFLGVAVLLWWASARAGGDTGLGPGALAVFLALLPLTVLGVGMTLATTPWYAGHRDVGDQQVAGVVMWAGGGLLALVGAVGLGVAWVARAAVTGDPGEGSPWPGGGDGGHGGAERGGPHHRDGSAEPGGADCGDGADGGEVSRSAAGRRDAGPPRTP